MALTRACSLECEAASGETENHMQHEVSHEVLTGIVLDCLRIITLVFVEQGISNRPQHEASGFQFALGKL